MASLAELLSELSDLDGDRKRDTRLPEAKIMELREWADRYHAPNTFKVGDIVTVRAGCGVKGDGKPHIVVGVNEAGFPVGTMEQGAPGVSDIGNITVLCDVAGRTLSYVLPHWKLEPFTA